MELRQLEYFLAVVKHGSISKAARALDARQPTLSVSLKNLEEELKSTLFHRDARGISLTAAGKVLRTTAEDIFVTIDRARAEISGLEAEDVGDFVLGCHDALGAYFLPAFLRKFMERAPMVRISLWGGTHNEVRNAVVERTIDFGLVVNPEPHPDLVIVPLYRDGIEVYVCAHEPAPRTVIEAYVRMKRGPLLVSRRESRVTDLLARFASDEVLPDQVLECGDLQLLRALVKEGLGVGLIPRRVARHGASGELRVLHSDLPGVPEVIYLLYRVDMHRTRAAMRLKDFLVEYGRTLQSSDPGEHSILPP